MLRANRRFTTPSMLDAIAPNRTRFAFFTHPAPARCATLALIDRLAADLAAKGPVFPVLPKDERNPYATSWGKVLEQPKFTAWEMQQAAARRAKANI